MSRIDYAAVVKFAVDDLMNGETIAMPVYRADIRSTADADARSEDLPLVYIWNEDRQRGSFTLTVNGGFIGHALEGIIPRSDPQFNAVRDEIMSILAVEMNKAVIATCQKMNCFPSQAF